MSRLILITKWYCLRPFRLYTSSATGNHYTLIGVGKLSLLGPGIEKTIFASSYSNALKVVSNWVSQNDVLVPNIGHC